jgi:hypothetical protein
MSNTKKYQTIIINSAHRENGTIGNFQINLHDKAIRTEDANTVLKLSVLQLSLNKSWYTVSENTTFLLNNETQGKSVEYAIVPGYYSVTTLAAFLIKQFSLGLTEANNQFMIVHDPSQNKFSFRAPSNYPDSYSFTFFDNSAHLFGFEDFSTTSPFTNAIDLISTRPVLMNKETTIYIHTSAPRRPFGAICNLEGGDFKESSVLCAITNIAAPFQNMTVDPANSFAYFLSGKELKDFSVFITDQNRKLLNLQVDWQMCLLVEHVDLTANMAETNIISEIRDMIKMKILQGMK